MQSTFFVQPRTLSLKEHLKTNSFEKITVAQICDNAYLSRQTFYNHFQDKYNFVNWILENYFRDTHRKKTRNESWSVNMAAFLDKLTDESAFFQKVYRYLGQNTLEEHLFQL